MLRRRWPVFLLLLIPLLPLWRAVFTGQAIGPFDQIRQFAPWYGPAPSRPWDVLQADGVLQFYVWRDLVFNAWGHGQLPFWNPYVLAGTPLLANSQSAGFYPPHILLGLLHVPTAIGMLILAWFHLAWAGLGTYVLVRRLGGSSLGAWLAGASFALSPFMLAWTGLPSVITTVSWIPWMLACIAGLYLKHPFCEHLELQEEQVGPIIASDATTLDPEVAYGLGVETYNKQKELRTNYRRLVAGLTGSTAMLILSGHLQFVAYGFMAAGLFSVALAWIARSDKKVQMNAFPLPLAGEIAAEPVPFRLPWLFRPRVSATLLTLSALVCGVLIAAPQLLPVLQYSQFSHRRTPATAEGYAAYVAGSIKPFELESLPFSTLLGNPAHFATLDTPTSIPPISTYWPMHVKVGANFAESAISVGPLLLGLLFLAPWRKSWKALLPISVVGLVAVLLAMGTPLNLLLYYGVPGWSASGSPGRIVVLFVLACCVIGGLSIDRLSPLPKEGLRRLLPVLLPALLSAVFIGLAAKLPPGDLPPFASVLPGQAFREAAPLLLVALVVASAAIASAYYLERPLSRAIVALAPLALFALAGGLELIPTGDPGFLTAASRLKPADPMARIAVVNDSWGIAFAGRALAPPNTLAVAGLHDLGGYDSLIHRDTVAMLKDVDGKDAAPPANGNMMFVKPTANPDALAQAGVTEVWSQVQLPQLGESESDGNLVHYQIAGPGRASTPAGAAEIESESPTQIRLKATGPGKLTLRDRNMPGWLAKVDGQHVPIDGTTWREIDLPEGSHEIEFNYVPPGFMPGLDLGGLGILALLAVFLPTLRRPSNDPLPTMTEKGAQ